MATSIPHFVTFEVRTIDAFSRLRFLAPLRNWALIAMVGMELVIYMALEFGCAMKPWAGANEDVPVKPFRTVVAGGSTGIRSDVIVTIGTVGSYSDIDADLGLRFGGGGGSHEADSSNSS
jgi:hypothetical protein